MSKSPQEQLDYLAWSACDKIAKMVELPDVSFEDRHAAIQRVRNHLESRAAQTATPFVPPTSEMLPDAPAWLGELDPALAALL
jgi:hypothetical protein